MTELQTVLAALAVGLPLAVALACAVCGSERPAARLSLASAPVTAGVATLLAILALARPGEALSSRALLVDPLSAVFLLVIAVVGAISALVSPAYLAGSTRSVFPERRARAWYYGAFHAFWAVLLCVPLVGNLGVSWLLVEATTAASAVLVAYSGRRSALEAGWKYLVLTTVGLTVALLGIVMLFVASGAGGFAALDWVGLSARLGGTGRETAIVALALTLVGLAAKVGWAPVHNWLPDAHSEAPPPVSALLSAALLPTAMLVAWRLKESFDPVIGERPGRALFLGFGIASLVVAVPFLWRPLAWKRLLAYSSLEHMGVLALGIGFGHPLAIAGVVVHVAGHALAKSLGFWAATPLLSLQPWTARRPASGLARTSGAVAGAVGVALASLSGLPPSPIFVSELLILAGGVLAGQLWVVAVAAVLLALGFLGLAHALVEGLGGKARRREGAVPGLRGLRAATVAVTLALAGLTAGAFFLPGSSLVDVIARWPG